MAVVENIALIQNLFQETRINYPIKGVEAIEPLSNKRYGAVFYESGAVCEAIKDYQKDDKEFNNWSSFTNNYQDLYASQLHVGLGWAMGETGSFNSSFIDGLNPAFAWRVIDGFAYYKGLFERRTVVRNAIIPEYINGEHLHAFDEGLGRSLWYTCQGGAERVRRSIELFNSDRHADLLRGIGIAAIYVGGLSLKEFEELLSAFPKHKNDIICGALMASGALIKSGVTQEIDLNFAKNPLFEQLINPCSGSFYSIIIDITKSISY